MSRHKVSISVKDSHLYEYLKTKDNISSYICKLIEADMQNVQYSKDDLVAKVEKILYRLLQNNHLYENGLLTIKGKQSETETLSSEDIDIINNLF
ncbi:hypothetical protein [Aneurinibacillus tyrosinisolvens]|uniref:hypothetical protein n=1 Tax=Aneurinibacillus tyrosinisolvens TaxID=1443435 RepID=UPI00063FB9EA|nr:hypothetical protein [Aneurinibacillus tyrosinisolvens]